MLNSTVVGIIRQFLSSICSLNNLLGSHPERCEPWSRITAAHDKGFLILEVK